MYVTSIYVTNSRLFYWVTSLTGIHVFGGRTDSVKNLVTMHESYWHNLLFTPCLQLCWHRKPEDTSRKNMSYFDILQCFAIL